MGYYKKAAISKFTTHKELTRDESRINTRSIPDVID